MLVLLELLTSVNGEARFAGIITANNVTIDGTTTITGDYDIQNSSGQITVGLVTATDLIIGTALTDLPVIKLELEQELQEHC